MATKRKKKKTVGRKKAKTTRRKATTRRARKKAPARKRKTTTKRSSKVRRRAKSISKVRRTKTRQTKRAGRFGFDPKSDNLFFGMVAGAAFFVFALWFASVNGPSSAQVSKQFKEAEKLSMSNKIEFWSRHLAENAPKQGATFLGSAPKIEDNAPLLPQKLNCTTFVETVAALATSKDQVGFLKNLKKIRYKNSKATFENRNHFPSLDWIPNNQSAGVLQDITKMVAEKADVRTSTVSKEINKKAWLKTRLKKGEVSRSIASIAEKKWKDGVDAKVRYIPLNEVDEAYKHIPNGSILNVVRKDKDGMDVLVSHQGFVFRYKGKVYFRHAISSGKIQTTELNGYLKRRAKNEEWPVVGINLNKIRG